MAKRRVRIACCIPEALNAHTEYVILVALSVRQWLRERALVLPYTYIARLVASRYNCGHRNFVK